jgi:hypothetical protein
MPYVNSKFLKIVKQAAEALQERQDTGAIAEIVEHHLAAIGAQHALRMKGRRSWQMKHKKTIQEIAAKRKADKAKLSPAERLQQNIDYMMRMPKSPQAAA